MANENRCPKCKGPMAESYSTPGRFFCIATDKDCRIQELVRMNLEQAINFGELAKRFDALKVELKEAKAHEIEAWDAKSAQDDENWKFIENLKSERDAALAQVVARRCLIDDFFNYVGGADDPRLDDHLMDRAVDALTDTQALANQRVEAIRREAASELMQALRDYGQHQRAIPELGVKGCDYDPEEGIPCTCGLAAILGEKGQG